MHLQRVNVVKKYWKTLFSNKKPTKIEGIKTSKSCPKEPYNSLYSVFEIQIVITTLYFEIALIVI